MVPMPYNDGNLVLALHTKGTQGLCDARHRYSRCSGPPGETVRRNAHGRLRGLGGHREQILGPRRDARSMSAVGGIDLALVRVWSCSRPPPATMCDVRPVGGRTPRPRRSVEGASSRLRRGSTLGSDPIWPEPRASRRPTFSGVLWVQLWPRRTGVRVRPKGEAAVVEEVVAEVSGAPPGTTRQLLLIAQLDRCGDYHRQPGEFMSLVSWGRRVHVPQEQE